MARENFAGALAGVLVHEGGYVDHPKDPGGATNMGITHRVLAEWRGKSTREVSKQDVRNLTKTEAGAIYRARYWNEIKGDDLPAGVDYAVFDFAVNSGPARAAKFLQRIAGVPQDGRIGPVTLAAVRSADPGTTIIRLCDDRLAWLKTLSTFSTFGRGWSRRVGEVKIDALAMAGVMPRMPDDPGVDPAPPDKAPASPGLIFAAIIIATALVAVFLLTR
ncbi:glycoside hydrolase family 108 protein [Pelagibacterium sediminicola]|uniref:glycoside hydrolase family 108 protein n=1 Tax=Pelagibacterium sediminicola TaxID=2248761 RepID=UPI000E31A944|nr:glycoside hydrolase family 108 protein [Pelagibacterium sediminicola]